MSNRAGRLRLGLILGFACGLPLPASAQVFINEIHYDNDGTDTGEAVEIAGVAGTDLSGWSLVRYNGNGGATYGTDPLSGVLTNQQGGFGTIVVEYPSNGLQNGSPDGIALVDATSVVVQFLSYEGTFVAADGPASGMTSVDIGVEEPGNTPVGFSLQLTGTGSTYAEFTWAAAAPNTFCDVNAGQTFGDGSPGDGIDPCDPGGGGDPGDVMLVINEIDYDQPSTDTAEFIELKNVGAADVALTGVSVELVNGSNDTVYNSFDLPDTILAPGAYFVICGSPLMTPRCDVDASIDSNLIQNGSPDAARIVFDGVVIDAVSYEGDVPSSVEGSGSGLEDSGSIDFVSISRFPDGADTGQNNVDLSLRCATPGAANSAETADCPNPMPPLVINEVHADPDAALGDANADGVVDTSEDEFVEIVNVSDSALDISGWTISDAVGIRHTFSAGTVVPSQCAIVVFGGGLPGGEFGGAQAQASSTGLLGLNNGGDTITIGDGSSDVVAVGYGAEGGDNQSLTRDPDLTGPEPLVRHSTATGSGGALYSPGTRVDGTRFDGCPTPPVGPFEIFQIQGAGDESPYVGQTVITEGNIVTAVGTDGFAMQTPDDRSDGNVDTSDGIFVFTGGVPTVSVGDLVNVTGEVIEFFGYTEFSNNPAVTIVSAGLPLPAPVVFDAMTPSPDPANPSCAIEYECYEGMLVAIAGGTVTGPNQRFGTDPVAEVYVTAAPERTFREPGLEFAGMPGLPVWDGNPEVFELDPDKLGLGNRIIPAGSSFSATGILGFEFGGYELWPTSLAVVERELPEAVRNDRFLEASVGSLNLFRLFDDVDDPPGMDALGQPTDDEVVSTEEYQRRLTKLARYVVETMKTPDIIGVQEVESQKVLEDLAAAIDTIHPWAQYRAFVVEGNDIGGIDVGFLVRKWRVLVFDIEQIGAAETYVNPEDGTLDILHDRPPLVLTGWTGLMPIRVMVVHNRSLGGIETERVQVKRLEQAHSIARAAQDLQGRNGKAALVVVGDFNAHEFSDGYVDTVGHIRGDFDPAESVLSGEDLVNPDLLNQVMSLPETERYSFVFDGNAQVLDHALTSRALDFRVRGLEYARGNADAAEDLVNDGTTLLRASDHDGLVLYIDTGLIWRW